MEERKLEEKELLTVEESIKLSNLSLGKFKRLIREVELSFVVPYGKQRFIIREELIRYIRYLSKGEQENLINAKFKNKKRLEA